MFERPNPIVRLVCWAAAAGLPALVGCEAAERPTLSSMLRDRGVEDKLTRTGEEWEAIRTKVVKRGDAEEYWRLAELALHLRLCERLRLALRGEPGEPASGPGKWDRWLKAAVDAYGKALSQKEASDLRMRLLLCLLEAYPQSGEEFWRRARESEALGDAGALLAEASASFTDGKAETAVQLMRRAAASGSVQFHELEGVRKTVEALTACGYSKQDALLAAHLEYGFSSLSSAELPRLIRDFDEYYERLSAALPRNAEECQSLQEVKLQVLGKIRSSSTGAHTFLRMTGELLKCLRELARVQVEAGQPQAAERLVIQHAREVMTQKGVAHCLALLAEQGWSAGTENRLVKYLEESERFGTLVALSVHFHGVGSDIEKLVSEIAERPNWFP